MDVNRVRIMKEEGEIIDVKRFENWLIIAYKGHWGISFEKLKINDKENE